MTETELKLEILPTDLDALLGSDLLGEPSDIIDQHSTYFDFEDRRLHEAGFTLRIRQSGDARIQTVKASGPGASLFARGEWETPAAGDMPVFDHSNPLLNEFGDVASALSSQFTVSVQRRVWNLKESGSEIELVIDLGNVVSGDRQTPILEMELELKQGKAGDLFAFARKIEAVVPFKFGVLSKAERGYRLMQAQQTVVKAEPIELVRETTVADAFQTIAGSCFRQFRLNEAILLDRRNAEALHQARVALRRLRSALSLFKPLFREETAERLSGEFRWLAGVLGEARNLDVLLPKASALRPRLEEERTSAYDDVFEALVSYRARALMLDFNEWLHCGEYLSLTDEQARKPGVEFACAALDKKRRKLKKQAHDLAGIDDEQRHDARKGAKKLRYAAEFFGSLFADKGDARRYKRFIAAMETLQDQLGALNDLATGPDVLAKYGLQDHPEAEKLILHGNKSALIRKAQDAVDDLLDANRFWRG